jgi:VanZ family protein
VVSLSDKFNHFIAFFTLYLLFERAHESFTCKMRIVLLLLYALLIELIQYFLPTRSAEVLDVIVDFIGIITAYALLPVIKKQNIFAIFYRKSPF